MSSTRRWLAAIVGFALGFAVGAAIGWGALVAYNAIAAWARAEVIPLAWKNVWPLGFVFGLTIAVNVLHPTTAD